VNLAFSPEEETFRREVRAFIAAALPDDVRARVRAGLPVSKDDTVRWQRILQARGWIAPGWPVEHGGCAWTPTQRYLFDCETVAGDAPFVNPFGLDRVGPVILAYGSAAQKATFLPRILDSTHWWCQGYSEPGAGSDLAALTTRAERRGDIYVVSGQKTWTSFAHCADWMFCLARTSFEARPRDGISFLLIDMKSRGVTVRPIAILDGLPHVSEVFLDGVEVPVAQRVGAEGQGWACARLLLGFERIQIAEVPQTRRLLGIARRVAPPGDPAWAARLVEAEIDLLAHETTVLRTLAEFAQGGAPGPAASMLKVVGSELRQRVTDLIVAAAGPALARYEPALLDDADADTAFRAAQTAHWLYSRASTIYGGANEVQKNILARAVLGL
jgi:alkylation response protein AidB-like acyl-CoA dehydrogenase